jgi:hypothetical protein
MVVEPLGVRRRMCRQVSDAIGNRSLPDGEGDGPHCHSLGQHHRDADAFPEIESI